MMQVFNSFSEHIKEKSKNPFFGTLICVWLARNWELIYTLFNFDDDCKLADKIQFVKDYYNGKSFWEELGTNVGIAFGLMLIGFFLLVVTKVIANIVNQRIIPSLNDKTVKGLTVNRSLYEQVKKHGLDLQNDLDIISKRLLDTEVLNSQLKTEKTNLEIKNLSLESDLQKSINKIDELNKKSELLDSIRGSQQAELWRNKLSITQLTDRDIIFEFLKREGRSKNIGLPKIVRTYRKLINESLMEGFFSVANCITSDNLTTTITQSQFDKFYNMELISFINKDQKRGDWGISSKEVKFEPLGYSIYKNSDLLENTN